MDIYDREVEKAKLLIAAAGRRPDEFTFSVSHLPPDPDPAGMFILQYEIAVVNETTGKTLSATGGIGTDWVREFASALKCGHFD